MSLSPILLLTVFGLDPAPEVKPGAATLPGTTESSPMEEAPKPPPPLPKIDPATPLKSLLPTPPRVRKAPIYLGEDPNRVPEVLFEAPVEKALDTPEWTRRLGHAVAASLFLNAKEEDGYLRAMMKGREDLAGLPFLLGGACRTRGVARSAFREAVMGLRAGGIGAGSGVGSGVFPRISALGIKEDTRLEKSDRAREHALERAAASALGQIAGGMSAEGRISVVAQLAGVSKPEATRELARLAVFSLDREVRDAALEALSVRRERDYTEVLTAALRHPWPPAARNAAAAIVKLERDDLLPKLADLLDAPDPRSPRVEDGKTVAPEMVRVNHHKSCLLCHAAIRAEDVSDEVLVARMHLPSEKLPSPSEGYDEGPQRSNLLVRVDVTYLRQEFSALLEADGPDLWPGMQRFDFLVRKRELTRDEAEALRKRLEAREPGALSPYQMAAVTALRERTGRDFEASAEVWRKHLKSRP
jgi:hypothetical protein